MPRMVTGPGRIDDRHFSSAVPDLLPSASRERVGRAPHDKEALDIGVIEPGARPPQGRGSQAIVAETDRGRDRGLRPSLHRRDRRLRAHHLLLLLFAYAVPPGGGEGRASARLISLL